MTNGETGAGDGDNGTARDRIVLVTGVSGAGRSTVMKAFEDLGYEAVDNLPLKLLANLIGPVGSSSPSGTEPTRPLAVCAAVLALMEESDGS